MYRVGRACSLHLCFYDIQALILIIRPREKKLAVVDVDVVVLFVCRLIPADDDTRARNHDGPL